jgi:hypothetical protein
MCVGLLGRRNVQREIDRITIVSRDEINGVCLMDESQLLSRLRETCMCLPEVRETTKWGHPTFEAGAGGEARAVGKRGGNERRAGSGPSRLGQRFARTGRG